MVLGMMIMLLVSRLYEHDADGEYGGTFVHNQTQQRHDLQVPAEANESDILH